MLSGCFGGFALYPVECEADYPLMDYIYRKDIWGSLEGHEGMNPSGNPSNKDDFLREWGKPDEIATILPDKEMWAYNRSEYCGIVPIWGVPVPLVLPVCDAFDHITFRNDQAIHIHFRRMVNPGGFFTINVAHVESDKKCPDKQVLPQKVSEILPFPGAIWIPKTEHCRRVAYRDDAIWWTDGKVNTKIDPDSHEVLHSIPLSNSKYESLHYVRGFGSVWSAVDSKKASLLTRVDLETGNIVATIPLAKKAGPIATGTDAVWVLHDKLLSRISPETNQVVATIPLDYASPWFKEIAVSRSAVWIAFGPTVIRIDPFANQVVNSFQVILDTELPATILSMAATEDALWVMAVKERKKGFFDHNFNAVLAEYDTMTNVLRSKQHLGSGGGYSFFNHASIVALGKDVWVCLPRGLYFIKHFNDLGSQSGDQ